MSTDSLSQIQQHCITNITVYCREKKIFKTLKIKVISLETECNTF